MTTIRGAGPYGGMAPDPVPDDREFWAQQEADYWAQREAAELARRKPSRKPRPRNE